MRSVTFSVRPSSENAWSKHLNVGVVEVTSTVPKPCEVTVLVQPHEKEDTAWAGVHCNSRSDNESGKTNAQAYPHVPVAKAGAGLPRQLTANNNDESGPKGPRRQ